MPLPDYVRRPTREERAAEQMLRAAHDEVDVPEYMAAVVHDARRYE